MEKLNLTPKSSEMQTRSIIKKKKICLKKKCNISELLVIERSQHKKINREIYTCVSILLFAASPVQAGQAWYGIQLYIITNYDPICVYSSKILFFLQFTILPGTKSQDLLF